MSVSAVGTPFLYIEDNVNVCWCLPPAKCLLFFYERTTVFMLLCLLWGIHKSKLSPEQTFVSLSHYNNNNYYYYVISPQYLYTHCPI